MHILTNVFRRISSLGRSDRVFASSIIAPPLQKVEKVSFSNYCLKNRIAANYHNPLSSLSYLNGNESWTINNLFCNHQVRYMSKYISKSAKKRLTLTTKRAKKGFYKGNKCTNEGRITNKGRFIVNPLKRLQLIIPDLTDFKLKPYIAATASKYPPGSKGSRQSNDSAPPSDSESPKVNANA